MTSTTVTSNNDQDTYPSIGSASYCLGLLFTAYILSFIDRQILSLLVGPIRADFGISDFEYSLLAGAALPFFTRLLVYPWGDWQTGIPDV